jgi:photoactive yellow protein
MADEELDALDFGVIALDEDGIVLRYNLYEARMARLDRNQVLGRNFFHDVAPCTRSEAFQGRFRRAVVAGEAVEPEGFEFCFDFAFGAQKVFIEIVRIAGAQRYYLLINRRALLPLRPDLPKDSYAVQQRELAPTEAALGVRRDHLEQRILEVPWSLLAALRATCNRLAPETWQLFCCEWGLQWGQRVAIDLEAAALENPGRTLRLMTMGEVATTISGYLARQGWGLLRFDFEAAREGVIVVELARSALAESAPRAHAAGDASDLACHLLSGCLSGLLTRIAARRLAVREVSCRAGGAPHCSFVVVAHHRRSVLDAALSQGMRGIQPIRGALRNTPPTRPGSKPPEEP